MQMLELQCGICMHTACCGVMMCTMKDKYGINHAGVNGSRPNTPPYRNCDEFIGYRVCKCRPQAQDHGQIHVRSIMARKSSSHIYYNNILYINNKLNT